LPETDLYRLEQEILQQPPQAALPANLSQEWLGLINRDLEVALDDYGDDPALGMACSVPPIFLILHLLSGKYGRKLGLTEVSQDDLVRLLCLYQTEIVLELSRRRGGARFEPATVETMFERNPVVVGGASVAMMVH